MVKGFGEDWSELGWSFRHGGTGECDLCAMSVSGCVFVAAVDSVVV